LCISCNTQQRNSPGAEWTKNFELWQVSETGNIETA